jgi:general stress protein CsbA
MNRRAKTSIVALILFAAYCLFIVVVAVSARKGHDSGFWLEIGVIVLLSAGAVWLSRRIYRRAK